MTTVGIGTTPFHADAEMTVRLAVEAERLGFARFSVAEGWTHDATLVLARIAASTSQIGLATGVMPVWSRTPAAMAMAAATLQSASAGRFSLGLGASSPPLVEGLHGLQWSRPLDRLRTTLTTVRALLEGERLPTVTAPDARPLRIGAVPDEPIPLGLAALSAPSIRLAGELADAWLPFLWARSRLAEGREVLAGPTRILAGVPLAIGPDEETARAMAATWLIAYLTRMGPIYPRMLRERFGYAAAADALLAANADGGLPHLPAEAEALARDVTAMGTYDEAPEIVRSWHDAGAGGVDLVLPLGVPEDVLREMLAAAAPNGSAVLAA